MKLRKENCMSIEIIGEKEGFIIRTAKADDVDNYFNQNYCPLDKEVARLTGCKEEFTKEEVTSFFLKSLEEKDRYFFLIIAPDGRNWSIPYDRTRKRYWNLGNRSDS